MLIKPLIFFLIKVYETYGEGRRLDRSARLKMVIRTTDLVT
jgi:hypothetical protein